MIYALDSNIVSYALKDDEAILSRIEEEAARKNSIVIPPIVYYEVKRWLYLTQSIRKERSFKNLCGQAVAPLDEDTLEKAAQIYAQLTRIGKLTSDADILIAAFCIVNQYVLVTNNEKHFIDIEGLKMTNWAAS